MQIAYSIETNAGAFSTWIEGVFSRSDRAQMYQFSWKLNWVRWGFSLKRGIAMARCETCGNEYLRSFTVLHEGQSHEFDSFECAIHALAP